MTNAWVVRAGRDGEEQANLGAGTATIGWGIGDLARVKSREDVRAAIDGAYPDDSPGRLANHTGQVWPFCALIQPGEVVIMPSKLRPGYMYFGKCTGPYRYVADADPARRHQLPVEWLEEPVSKSAIQDNLLYSLNAIMTVFNPSRNNAAQRVLALYETGNDPGSASVPASKPSVPTMSDSATDDVTDPDPTPTIEAIRDRIRIHLVEHFVGHKMTRLVADVLEAPRYRCEVSPPGPDGAVDILAGRGLLGLDSPTLIVEVKSEAGAVDVKVVRGLHSAMTQHRADEGLLVAPREFLRDRTSFRVWDSEELLNRPFETYDRLPDITRVRIPLKHARVLDEDDV